MSNPLDLLKPKATLDRSAFPLSERHIYSARAGLIQPIKMLDVIPGDYIEGNILSLCRTAQPVVTDAFARMKCSFVVGFVPYVQLWSHWNDFILQTRENFSAMQTEDLPANVPYVEADDFLSYFIDTAYRVKRTESDGNPTDPDDYDMFGFPKYQNVLRMLDMLEYGSFYDLVEYAERCATDDASPDTHITNLKSIVTTQYSLRRWNVFRIMAYQKFCSDYMRSTVYEKLKPQLFNLDRANGQLVLSAENFFELLASMWYVLHRKDMFTALLPNAQSGVVSSVDLGSFSLRADNYNASNPENLRVKSTGEVFNSPGSSLPINTTYTSSASISVYDIRKAQMMQKWKEDHLRAGKKLKDQSLSQWGVRFHYLEDKYSQYIKEIDFNISIDEVVNQAGGTSGQLGDIAGKGVGTGQGDFKFRTDDFGVLMILQIIQPFSEYDNLGTHKDNTLIEPFDFVTPVFENLGLEAVHGFQLRSHVSFLKDWTTPSDLARALDKTLGFGARYLSKKVGFDRVHGEFMGSGHYDQAKFPATADADARGTNSIWCTPRLDMEKNFLASADGISIESLKVNPHILDTIFLKEVDGSQTSDQFLFNTNLVLNSVRDLTVSGLPRW